MGADRALVADVLSGLLSGAQAKDVLQVCDWLPVIQVLPHRPYLPSERSKAAQGSRSQPPQPSRPNPQQQPQQQVMQGAGWPEKGGLTHGMNSHQAGHRGMEQGGWEEDGMGTSGGVSSTQGCWGGPRTGAANGDDGGGGCDGSGGTAEEEESWVLEVDLRRLRGGRGKRGRPRAYAPRFPKIKEEGWYLIAGDMSTHELLALKRVGLEEKTTVKLMVPRYNGAGQLLRIVTLYLMSDCYIGLDQQYDVALIPQPAAPGMQACTPAAKAAAGAVTISDGAAKPSAAAIECGEEGEVVGDGVEEEEDLWAAPAAAAATAAAAAVAPPAPPAKAAPAAPPPPSQADGAADGPRAVRAEDGSKSEDPLAARRARRAAAAAERAAQRAADAKAQQQEAAQAQQASVQLGGADWDDEPSCA